MWFHMTVPLPVLHVEYAIGLTTTFWKHGLEVQLPQFKHPVYFNLWGFMKQKVYATDVWDREDLINSIEKPDADIRNLPTQRVKARGSVRSRCEASVQKVRVHLEHPLYAHSMSGNVPNT
jgi:hypothetical protein